MPHSLYSVLTPCSTPQALLESARQSGLTANKLIGHFTHALSAKSSDKK